MNSTKSLPLAVKRPALQAFNVWLGRNLIDTVFYSPSANTDCEEVRRSLIGHDGYAAEIVVRKARK